MSYLNVGLIENTLIKENIAIFSVKEFSKLFKIMPSAASAFLIRNSRKENSRILRLKRGLYAFSITPPTKFEIANKLYQPSYISFETALSYHKIILETVYTLISTTTKKTKEFNIQNSNFKYYKIKKKLFFGYSPQTIREKIVLMAEPEKALLDYVYYLTLKKQPFNERLNLNQLNKNKLGRYINYFKKNIRKNKTFINLIQEIYKSL